MTKARLQKSSFGDTLRETNTEIMKPTNGVICIECLLSSTYEVNIPAVKKP